MEPNEAFKIVDQVFFQKIGRHFSDQEREVFLKSWIGNTYEEMAEDLGYSSGFLAKTVGSNLWNMLSNALGERVTKKNFRWTVERNLNSLIPPSEKISSDLSMTSGNTFVDSKSSSPISSSKESQNHELDCSRRMPHILERGSADSLNSLVDAVLDLAERRYEFGEELYRFVLAGQPVPIKYLYNSPIASRNWIRLCQKESYSFYRHSLKYLTEISSDIVDQIILHSGSSEIDFVSLGSGDGQKDLQLLLALVNKLSEDQYVYYYPVDISDSMIVEAIRAIGCAGIPDSRLRIKAIIGDYMHLRNFQIVYEERPVKNIFSFLGNSFGNSDESKIVESINNAIFDGDFVLIEVNVGNPEEMLAGAFDPINVEFDFTPLSTLGVHFDPSLMSYSIENNKSTVHNTKSLIATYKEANLDGSTLRNITLSVIHHYQIETLLDYLERRMKLKILWYQCKNEVGIILAQRPVDSKISHLLTLVYDSQYEKDFDQWDIFSSINEPEKGIRLVDDSSNENTIFEIQAFSTESVGINKSLRLLHGKVEFEYKVISSKATQQNIYFCIIPMKEPTRDCFGLLEVGAEVQDDPKNLDSKYRERFYIPIDHYGSSQWHCASMFFDFRQTHKAFYSIFAPRINEGCSNPEPACFLTKNLRVYSFE